MGTLNMHAVPLFIGRLPVLVVMWAARANGRNGLARVPAAAPLADRALVRWRPSPR
jgi:hypothetical protein